MTITTQYVDAAEAAAVYDRDEDGGLALFIGHPLSSDRAAITGDRHAVAGLLRRALAQVDPDSAALLGQHATADPPQDPPAVILVEQDTPDGVWLGPACPHDGCREPDMIAAVDPVVLWHPIDIRRNASGELVADVLVDDNSDVDPDQFAGYVCRSCGRPVALPDQVTRVE